jgi:dolichol-phosphate mannosyltransferase
LTIVIPAHNEEGVIEERVRTIIEQVTVPDYEILICNDHSIDNTLEIAKQLAKKRHQVRDLSNTDQRGFGNVMRFGFRHAKGRFVVPMMADLCDDPKTVNRMFLKAMQGYDVIVGSRYIKGGGKRNIQNRFKSFCSWGIGQFGYYIHGIKIHDTTNAFKMVRREALKTIKLTSNNFDISLELTMKLHKKGFKITEVPTVWVDRSDG